MKATVFALAAVSAAIFGSTAFAAPPPVSAVGCPAAGANSVTTATDCAFVDPGNDQGTPGINGHNVFGKSDWVMAWDDVGGAASGQPDFGFGGTFAGTSGTWEATNGFLGYKEVVFVVKASNRFAAYLLDTTVTSGTWTTANILMNNQGNAQAISHATVFFRGEPEAVPLPGAFLLFGTAAAGAAALKRRRAAKA